MFGKLSSISLFIAWTLCIISNSSLNAQNSKLDKQEVIDRHKASRELIRTLICEVSLVGTKNDQQASKEELEKYRELQSSSGKYWFSGNKARSIVKNNYQTIDSVWENGIAKNLIYPKTNSGLELSGANKLIMKTPYWTQCDPYYFGLLALPPPMNIAPRKLENLVPLAAEAECFNSTSSDGRSIPVLMLLFKPTKENELKKEFIMEIEFDPKYNFLIRKMLYKQPGNDPWLTMEVQNFIEQLPGIYFPEKTIVTSYEKKAVFATSVAVFSNIIINDDISEDIFQVKYPYGISVSDETTNSRYKVNEDGEPISEPVPTLKAYPPPPAAKASTESQPTQSDSEESSWNPGLFWISLALAILGVSLYFWKRK